MASIQEPSNNDVALLASYVSSSEQSIFAEIVQRHVGMVRQVCLRVLRDEHLAEDATQETFVTLAQKASRIESPELLSNWLYGVAVRTSMSIRRKQSKAECVPLHDTDVAREYGPETSEVAMAIDSELAAMPDKYRTPLVMHYFSGMTVRQIARAVSISSGTISSRLQRGRSLLRSRLAKRGIRVGALVTLFATTLQNTAEASSGEVTRLADRSVGARRHQHLTKIFPVATIVVLILAAAGVGAASLVQRQATVATEIDPETAVIETAATAEIGVSKNGNANLNSALTRIQTPTLMPVSSTPLPNHGYCRSN